MLSLGLKNKPEEFPSELLLNSIPHLSKVKNQDILIKKLAGKTNRNYLIDTGLNQFVLRIPRASTNPCINRNHENFNNNLVQTLDISPLTVWRQKNKTDDFTGVSLSTYIPESSTLTLDNLHDPSTLKRLSSVLKELQNSKIKFKGKLDNQKIKHYLHLYFDACSKEKQTTLKDDFIQALELLELIQDSRSAVPSHIDLVKENILIQSDKIWLIDWEYSAMASPFWDIATLCNTAEYTQEEAKNLLKLMFKDYKKNDIESLNQYRQLTETMDYFWEAAFRK